MTEPSAAASPSTTFDAGSTGDDVASTVDLTGRRAVVTGGGSGVGLEIARSLARAGADVVLGVRRVDQGEVAAQDLRTDTRNDNVTARRLDLGDQTSVADFVASWEGPLHILVNNAGVMAVPDLTRTPEGWELQFATNHLGHFALAVGLQPALASAGDARVVSVSSSGHHAAQVDFDDVHFRSRDYDPWIAYGQSKTANVLFAVEAHRRWSDDGITANAVMPGGIMTGLQRHLPAEVRQQWARIPTNKTPQQGAATSVYAAVAPELAGRGGLYLEDCHPAPVLEDQADTDGVHGVRRWAVDADAARRLWDLSLSSTDHAVR